jgi:hypothetical protein
MKRLVRLGVAICLGLAAVLLAAGLAAAAGPPATCTAALTIATTSVGDVSTAGQVTHYRDSGVAGVYTSGPLAGYAFSGAQNIMVNNATNQSELQGQYTASGPGGALTISYTGHADLTTGAATGHFVATDGTGRFAGFHWEGDIAAQLVSLAPPTFLATDSGPCLTAP